MYCSMLNKTVSCGDIMKRVIFLLLMSLMAHNAVAEGEKVIRLSSLEWPPYAGADLPGQGASIMVVRQALAAMGYELEVDFYPWSRAVHMAEDASSGYAGYFPEYHSEAVALQFVYSDPIGYGPLGFAAHKGADVTWDRLVDLDRYTIGTVKDYVNTSEFDSLVAGGMLNISESLTDTSNLLKVAYQRIDIAVIDENVMEYLVRNEPDLRRVGEQLEFNPQLLEMKALYVCFNRSSPFLASILNQGLTKVDVRKIQDEYFANLSVNESANSE